MTLLAIFIRNIQLILVQQAAVECNNVLCNGSPSCSQQQCAFNSILQIKIRFPFLFNMWVCILGFFLWITPFIVRIFPAWHLLEHCICVTNQLENELPNYKLLWTTMSSEIENALEEHLKFRRILILSNACVKCIDYLMENSQFRWNAFGLPMMKYCEFNLFFKYYITIKQERKICLVGVQVTHSKEEIN